MDAFSSLHLDSGYFNHFHHPSASDNRRARQHVWLQNASFGKTTLSLIRWLQKAGGADIQSVSPVSLRAAGASGAAADRDQHLHLDMQKCTVCVLMQLRQRAVSGTASVWAVCFLAAPVGGSETPW